MDDFRGPAAKMTKGRDDPLIPCLIAALAGRRGLTSSILGAKFRGRDPLAETGNRNPTIRLVV